MKKSLDALLSKVPDKWKATALLHGFGLFKIPMLFSLQPRVLEISEERVIVKVPLNRWSRNHLGSMYFGAMAIGADCVVGLLALSLVHKRKGKVNLAFKDFKADFLKRPESDVVFVCEKGREIGVFVDEVLKSPERMNLPVECYAALASKPEEPVAKFVLTLSLKRKA